jgi:hypothetical protein
LIGTASDNPEITSDKVTLNLNAREYIDNQNNSSLLFNLYHFPDDSYLSPITAKVLRGTLLYVTGYLSIIDDLLLIRLTQINFIESASITHKPSNYAWEKQSDSSTQSTSSAAEIAKSISAKSNKKEKRQAPNLLQKQYIPKLDSLTLSTEDILQDEIQEIDETEENQKNNEVQEYQQNKKHKYNIRTKK